MIHHKYPENPVKHVGQLEAKSFQYWTYSQANLDALQARARVCRESGYHRTMIALSYWPVRISEILTMSGMDLFFDKDYVSIQDDNSKTDEGRILRIPAKLRPHLAGIPRTCPHLFCTTAKGHFPGTVMTAIDRKNLYRWLGAQVDDLKLPGHTLHGFRRTVATRMDENGEDILTIARTTGHTDFRTLRDRYLRASQKRIMGAMERYEEAEYGQNMDKSHLARGAA
jgi:integrase